VIAGPFAFPASSETFTIADGTSSAAPTCESFFEDGFCTWNQVTAGDDFDWTIMSGSTPTSETGPGNGFGGAGSYIFIEADGQTEGATASITSTETGCGLKLAYHM